MVGLLESSVSMVRDLASDPRDRKARAVRWIKQNGDCWELAFFLALMVEKQGNAGPHVVKEYEELYDFVMKENLSMIFNIKPLLDVVLTLGKGSGVKSLGRGDHQDLRDKTRSERQGHPGQRVPVAGGEPGKGEGTAACRD